MNLRRHGKVTIKSIDETRDESEIESAGHSAQRGAGCRDAVELCFSRGQSRDGNRAAAHLNDIRTPPPPLFFKKTVVLRHKEESGPFAKIGGDNRDLLIGSCRRSYGDEQQRDGQCGCESLKMEPKPWRHFTDLLTDE